MATTLQISASEQYLLELINRMRLDPVAEARRFGLDLNQGLTPGTITAGPRQVLAHNALLEDAAISHSRWLLANDAFAHQGAGGSQPGDRAGDAGYNWRSIGENLSVQLTTGSGFDAAALVRAHHEGLFRSPGHRANMLNPNFRETGLSIEQAGGYFYQGRNWTASMLTEMFGLLPDSPSFLTGVVYQDRNGDDFYSIGEGQSGARFTTPGDVAVSGQAGGYTLNTGGGAAVEVGGRTAAGLDFRLSVDMSRGNVKLDLLGGVEFLTSGSLTLISGIRRVTAIGTEAVSLGGTAGADVITGNGGANTLRGNGGADTVEGGGGADHLYGGAGNDRLYGGAGNDRLWGDAGNDLLYGGAGNDILRGVSGNDRLWGASGNDSLYGGTGNDQLQGEAGNDRLWGEAGTDTLSGGDGNDSLYGGDGGDSLYGGAGIDRLWGDLGNDQLWGDTGNDLLYGGGDHDTLRGGLGNDSLYGGTGNDLLTGDAGADRLWGDAGNDRLYGQADNDRLYGGAGNDRLWGGAGNDQLYGGAGNDTLSGGTGNDTLRGEAGNDRLIGGTGADHFVFGRGMGRDVVTDFTLAQGDRLVLSRDLWRGQSLDAAGVLAAFASVSAGGVTLDFGAAGTVVLEGIGLAGLAPALDLV